MHTFISYQTEDKKVAGKVKSILEEIGISSFMAHEDIHVSEEWRLKILEEIGKASIFLSLWSKDYYKSWWCIQESGIASFRKEMTIIPLSIDGSIPQGFASNVQATKIEPETIGVTDILPGLVKANSDFGINLILSIIKKSYSFRQAEENFLIILPFVEQLTLAQGKKLLEISVSNDQILHASLCASKYLPPLYKKYSHLLTEEENSELRRVLENYANK